jgi:hypothetical protein
MSIPVASERKLLTSEDFEAVKATHHPAISDLDLEALQSAKRDLGERREKLRARLVESRRARVRRTPSASPSSEPQLARRTQVFAKALRRVNHELHRREEAEAKVTAIPVSPRPEPKAIRAPQKAAASAPKDTSTAKPSRVRTAKARPDESHGEAKGEAKGRKGPKKEN